MQVQRNAERLAAQALYPATHIELGECRIEEVDPTDMQREYIQVRQLRQEADFLDGTARSDSSYRENCHELQVSLLPGAIRKSV